MSMASGQSASATASAASTLSLPEFIDRTRGLLALEHSAEKDEAVRAYDGISHRDRERKGVSICRLKLTETKTSLNGRTVLRFASSRHVDDRVGGGGDGGGGGGAARLPTSKLRPGDVVGVSVVSGGVERQVVEGVLLQLRHDWLSIAVDEPVDDGLGGGGLVVTRRANEVTHKRLLATLSELTRCCTASDMAGSTVVRALFGDTSPTTTTHWRASEGESESESAAHTAPADEGTPASLNTSQEHAVKFCLAGPAVSVIHGPPGTGKTTTVVELIRQLARRGQKVLAAAPSNIAVDNLAEQLIRAGVKVVRIGHPARIMEAAQAVSLDALVDASDEAALVRDVRKEMNAISKQLSGKPKRRGAGDGVADGKRGLRQEFRALRKELRQRESVSIREVLRRVEVVLGTTSGLVRTGPIGLLPPDHFDVSVVDEAGQALEVACWTVLLRAPRCVLAGDHLQLPPTITSPEASKGGLQVTLLERAVSVLGGDGVCLLDTQYRMHEDIMRWSSDFLYGGRLVAADTVKARLLCDLPHVEEDDNTTVPLVYVDTAGCGFEESVSEEVEDASISNDGEALIIEHHVRQLVAAGLAQDEIGIITPYNGQVDRLNSALASEFPDVEIRSIDGFQGREKEAILISLVRCNQRRVVGFLSECRRLNVAVTRAKRHLFLVGDSVTISSNKKLATLVNYLGDTADVRSGFEFMNAVDGNVSMRSKPANSNPKRAERKFETEAERRDRFAATFAGFVADPRFETHTFPSILNSFERMLVHELAEEHGLGHISLGEDAERRIRVWRPAADAAEAAEPPAPQPLGPDEMDVAAPTAAGPTSTTHDADTAGGQEIASVRETATVVNAAVPSTRVAVDTNTAHSKKSKLGSEPSTTTVASTLAAVAAAEPAGTRCPVCRHKVPDANVDIHIVRCERKQRLEDKSRTLDATARKQHRGAHPASGNPAKSGGPSSDALSTEDSASDDAEIHRFTQNAQKCQKGGCPRSVVQIGSFCRHCSRTYCMAHSLPESHGCATAAATSARRHRSGEAPLLGGARSAPPRANNPNDPRSRTQLEKSLKSALQDKESARTPTAKGKDGKKKDTKKKKKKK